MPESVRDRPTSAHEHIFLLTKKARYFWDQDAVREDAASADRPKPTEDMKQRSPNGETPWLNNRYAPGPSGYGVNESGRNIRNVWSLSAEPLKEAHFAAFPTEIPRRCIKAGTSEKGACSACGAPWVRVVERTGGRDWRQDMMKPKGIPGERAGEGSYKRGQSTSPLNDTQRVKTVGWQPGCTCDAGEPIPCTVLDPFSGSGRTLFVAEELGRDSIGIELNAAYIDLSVRHIEQKTGYSVQRD